MRVPRWGTHDGVKYNQKRTIIKICVICNDIFIPFGSNRRITCSDKCQDIKAKQLNDKHNPINNPKNNFKNNPKNNPKYKGKYTYNKSREELNQIWNNWYSNLTPQQKIAYNTKKKQSKTKKDKYNHDDTLSELKALGLR